jgi:hypothetical protein
MPNNKFGRLDACERFLFNRNSHSQLGFKEKLESDMTADSHADH